MTARPVLCEWISDNVGRSIHLLMLTYAAQQTAKYAASFSLAVILNENVGRFSAGQRVPRHYDPKLSAMEPDGMNTLATEYRCDLAENECD